MSDASNASWTEMASHARQALGTIRGNVLFVRSSVALDLETLATPKCWPIKCRVMQSCGSSFSRIWVIWGYFGYVKCRRCFALSRSLLLPHAFIQNSRHAVAVFPGKPEASAGVGVVLTTLLWHSTWSEKNILPKHKMISKLRVPRLYARWRRSLPIWIRSFLGQWTRLAFLCGFDELLLRLFFCPY